MDKCIFCNESGGEVIYTCHLYRIILVDDPFYPGYLRVILNQHIKELTDLTVTDNLALYQAVIKCEQIIRIRFNPDKVNLASFGNLTPHVHWHIIPRFIMDRHFPNPVWGETTNPDYVPSHEILKRKFDLISKFEELFLA